MQEPSTSPATILQFRQDIEEQFRRQIREALERPLPRSSPPPWAPSRTSGPSDVAGIGTATSNGQSRHPRARDALRFARPNH